ncbi:MAG: von Willebrand factor type A domain-containing protein [Saprospiraceae bacterium]|nr:von Willebrand factor type A domain-containing protein [Saprospiraceae bacterium]
MMTTIYQWMIMVSLVWVTNPLQRVPTSSTITGKMTDAKTGEAIAFGTVVLYQKGLLIKGTESDIDGKYHFQQVNPGTYDIEASLLGYAAQKIENVIIKAGKTNVIDFQLSDDAVLLELGVEVRAYKVPLIQIDNTIQGSTVTAQKIKKLPFKGVDDIQNKATNNDEVNIRGSRANETVYFIDGIRVTGGIVPENHHGSGNTESYAEIRENKFVDVQDESLSTFALDVDRAAYSNVRRFINGGQLPPADAVRIEEMINYFVYDYPQPKGNDILGVTTHMTECPWNQGLKLLHVGVQSKKVDVSSLPPSNLVFLIDVSGSMGVSEKLPLVIASLKVLVNQLRPEDKVAIVTYAGYAGVALPSTFASEKQKIMDVLDGLQSGGSTAGAQGIVTAYQIALENFIPKGNNRVILATDGDFNVGLSDNRGLEKLIEEKRNSGVFLSVLGYGMGNYKDDKMQILADKGNGNHAYIDDMQEAVKVLGDEFGGTMYTLAKDVKFQIEFNPDKVRHFRLVGYENRMLEKEDFNDDAKDGGELGMGHQMTAIYELVLADDENGWLMVDPLKYQETKKNIRKAAIFRRMGNH